ncbi:MAG TPA: hypothetical protein VM406_05350, partial [Noviherbaspirillum sp.]|nr:hypothetical protein [Noviherbaspirillum sp.]
MAYPAPRTLTVALLSALLVACGGGGDNNASHTTGNEVGSRQNAGLNDAPDSGAPPQPATGEPAPVPAPVTAFSATLASAPPQGATINAPVRIEVHGSALENVE